MIRAANRIRFINNDPNRRGEVREIIIQTPFNSNSFDQTNDHISVQITRNIALSRWNPLRYTRYADRRRIESISLIFPEMIDRLTQFGIDES